MRWRRFRAVLAARNKEFLRDRATLGWNLAFPLLVLVGMSFIFSGRGELSFRVAVMGAVPSEGAFFTTAHVDFESTDDLEAALAALRRHSWDMVIDPAPPRRYWINSSSAKGEVLERLLLAPATPTGGNGGAARDGRGGAAPGGFERETVSGRELRYVDWLLPGMLGMNAMFSCLFGVGFVIVRYRKNGVLRRLDATPLTSFEFLAAQVVSRVGLVLLTSAMVYVGADLLLDFRMVGSYLDLVLVFVLGAVCMVALGLAFASRTASEELAGGILNLATWPMMLLGGVWFPLDGSPGWVRAVAAALPLTHLVDAARAIMNDGAGLGDLAAHLAFLAATSLVLLATGSALFRWE